VRCGFRLIPFPVLLAIMPCSQDQEALIDVVDDAVTHPAGAAYQSRLPLSPFRVPALDPARQPTAFLAHDVLRTREEARVGSPVVGEDKARTPLFWYVAPGVLEHRVRPVAEHEPEDLPYPA